MPPSKHRVSWLVPPFLTPTPVSDIYKYLTIFVKVANLQKDSPVTAGGYVGVIAIYIYAFGWSFGWSVVPWVVPSEIFPNRVRAICMSSIYAFQWLLNFAITRGTPYMMLNMHKWGAYLLFSVFTFGSVGRRSSE